MNNNLIEAKAGLDTTYRGYEKFEVTFKHAGPADNFKTSASFTTPLRRYQKFSFELTHRGTAADFTTALKLESPFRDYTPLTVSLTHRGNTNDFSTTFKLESPLRDYFPLTVTLTHRGKLPSLNSELTVTWSDKVIKAATAFSFHPNIFVFASLETPFQNAEHLSFKFTTDGSTKNGRADLEVQYTPNQSQPITIQTRIIDGPDELSASALMRTPFAAFNLVGLTYLFQTDLTKWEFTTQFRGYWNNHTITTTAEWEAIENSLKFSGSLETGSIPMASITIEHTGRCTDFNNNSTLKYYGREFTFSSEFKKDGLTGKFDLRTPYEALQSLSLNFQHTNKVIRNGNGWSNTGSVEYNGQRYAGESEWAWVTKTQIKSKFAVTIPDEYSLTLTHKGDLSDFSNSRHLEACQQQNHSNIQLQNEQQSD